MIQKIFLPLLSLFLGCAHIQLDPLPTGPLPNMVEPLAYQLQLSIDPRKESFSGTTTIQVRTLKPTRHFWIHGKRLNILSTQISKADGALFPLQFTQYPAEGLIKLQSDQFLLPGKHTLIIKYNSPYEDGLLGLYKVSEGGHDYVFTQFEPIAARTCFPSFDEPRFKTPFSYELTVPVGMEAITSTQVVSERIVADTKTLIFAKSKPLPTYLVAFAVGPFDVVEAPDIQPNEIRKREIPFRGIAVKGKGHLLELALKETPAMVGFQENYTGIEYPYAKLDIIAIPDFASGAMENAGAITFREWLLLVDPKTGSESQKRAFASVMAHELGHQWFGNLVTMPWWNDLWLNEAFATWFGYKTIESLYPSHRADLGLLQRMHGAMNSDSLSVARRVREPIHSNHDIYNAFDSITYAKGASILGMFESTVGERKFKDIIRHYLQRHPFSVATGPDFVAAIRDQTSPAVAKSFQSFIENPGIPFITAKVACSSNRGNITFSQTRYTPKGSTINTSDTWSTPVCFEAKNRKAALKKCVFVEDGSKVALDFCPQAVALNPTSRGYYLSTTEFSTTSVENLSDQPQLNSASALTVAKNLSAQFRAGKLSAEKYLSALKPFSRSSSLRLKTAPIRDFEFMLRHQETEKTLLFLRNFYKDALRSGLEIGNTTAPETLIYFRKIYDLFLSHDPKFIAPEAMQTMAKLELQSILDPNIKSQTPNDLRSVALRYALRSASADTFAVLQERMATEKDTVMRNQLLYGLSATGNRSQISSVLKVIKEPNVLRKNELFQVAWNLMSHQKNQPVVWDWVKDNYAFLRNNVPRKRLSNLPYTAENFCSESRRLELLSFLGPEIESIPGGPPALAEVAEQISLCAALSSGESAPK